VKTLDELARMVYSPVKRLTSAMAYPFRRGPRLKTGGGLFSLQTHWHAIGGGTQLLVLVLASLFVLFLRQLLP
jgi:hypothetical protein